MFKTVTLAAVLGGTSDGSSRDARDVKDFDDLLNTRYFLLKEAKRKERK